MNNSIADYFATLSFRPDVASLRNVDRFLRIIERRIERYQRRGGAINLLNIHNIRNRNGGGGGGSGGGGTRTINPRPVNRQITGTISDVKQMAGAGLAGFGFGSLSNTLQKLELLPVAMESVTGSAESAAKQLEFLSKLGHEMGVTMLDMAPSYTKMLASAIGTPLEKEIQHVFTSLTTYGKVMGLDKEEMHGSYKAVTQMINKQQIYAEELNFRLAA